MEMRIVVLAGLPIPETSVIVAVLAIAVISVAAVIVIVNYYRTNKTMNVIEMMLSKAQNAEFDEADFDESRL